MSTTSYVQTDDYSYNILRNFDPREGGFTRHAAKLNIIDTETKSKIFKGFIKFRELDMNDPLKKVFMKNDDPPLTTKENDRLSRNDVN